MQRLANWQLFAVCIGVWGTTWHAITFQIGHTSPAVGVTMRFALAALLVLGLCRLRREPLGFGAREHGFFALQGVPMYGISYICVYEAERHLPSGLVAVGFSASPVIAALGARWLFAARLSGRFLAGGAVGLLGVALIFWREFSVAYDAETAQGAAWTLAAVTLSVAGSLSASRNAVRGLPFWPSLGFGMAWGALSCGAVALLAGDSFRLPHVVSWWVALAYLAAAGSVAAFACYLELQNRRGPGVAGTVGVAAPVLAIAVSTAFEGFQPDVLTGAGMALAVAGNVAMLRR